MRVAVVGATGLVGSMMLKILQERNFPVTALYPVATEKSAGREIHFKGQSYRVMTMEAALELHPDLALFSAGGATSEKWAPEFAKAGTIVIDNSSAWRMDPGKKLVVPEINAHVLGAGDKIIANPNCSTIQMVMALAPLHKAYGLSRIVVSTYQSVTGTGAKALHQLDAEIKNQEHTPVYPHQIFKNVIPQCDVFTGNGYTKEEMKMVNETRKILDDASIAITATAVRVPVMGGHSESVNAAFKKEFDLGEAIRLLEAAPGVTVVDNPDAALYPMPLQAHGKDEVFVGRIRRDESQPRTMNLWIVSDNLRKGAATNAIQIAEYLVSKNLLHERDAERAVK